MVWDKLSFPRPHLLFSVSWFGKRFKGQDFFFPFPPSQTSIATPIGIATLLTPQVLNANIIFSQTIEYLTLITNSPNQVLAIGTFPVSDIHLHLVKLIRTIVVKARTLN
jgi:hypothetical protein